MDHMLYTTHQYLYYQLFRYLLKKDQVETHVHKCPPGAADALQNEIGAKRHIADQTVSRKGSKYLAIVRFDVLHFHEFEFLSAEPTVPLYSPRVGDPA